MNDKSGLIRSRTKAYYRSSREEISRFVLSTEAWTSSSTTHTTHTAVQPSSYIPLHSIPQALQIPIQWVEGCITLLTYLRMTHRPRPHMRWIPKYSQGLNSRVFQNLMHSWVVNWWKYVTSTFYLFHTLHSFSLSLWTFEWRQLARSPTSYILIVRTLWFQSQTQYKVSSNYKVQTLLHITQT